MSLASIGNYTLSSLKLGEGSFSKVKLARHIILGTNVAIKVITRKRINDTYVAKNLKREAKIMGQLQHKNVVRLFEVTSGSGFYCLVMEYYGGGTLCELVQQRGKLQEADAKHYFRQTLSGLDYIHSQGVLHRDMKLENLLLDSSRLNLAISDFGLSNYWDPGTCLATHCGSAEYAAPELFAKRDYGPKVDIWSVGIVLYGMLTGELPFQLDDESDSKGIRQLISMINRGLNQGHHKKLQIVSLECRILLSRLICVDEAYRMTLQEVSSHAWTTSCGEALPLQGGGETPLTQEDVMQVAEKVRSKLNIHHLRADQVLEYVRSQKGTLGKTAGCFNILHREQEKQREQRPASSLQHNGITARVHASKLDERERKADSGNSIQAHTVVQPRNIWKNLIDNSQPRTNAILMEETVCQKVGQARGSHAVSRGEKSRPSDNRTKINRTSRFVDVDPEYIAPRTKTTQRPVGSSEKRTSNKCSFWNTEMGQTAIEALKKVEPRVDNPHLNSEKENDTCKKQKIKLRRETKTRNSRNNSDNEKVNRDLGYGKKTDPPSSWRRSVKPKNTGRPVRLKRMDSEDRVPLKCKDTNIM